MAQRSTKFKVNAGAVISINAVPEVLEDHPEEIPLEIVFEDESILVVNKPTGLVVSGAGNRTGTMLNVASSCADLEAVPRAGIVHRLDKETTRLMVVAKTLQAQTHLVASSRNAGEQDL